MIAVNIALVCLLAWTTGTLVNIMTEKNQQTLQSMREADQQRTIDTLYGRVR